MTAHEAYILLNMTPGVGPKKAMALLSFFDDASEIFNASARRLREIQRIGPQLADKIEASSSDAMERLEEELTRAFERGLTLLTPAMENYPRMLRSIYDPPLALYIWGELTEADDAAMAMVGSRRATTYGISVANRLGFQLAQQGMTVVSGLARGIDTAAHDGALKAKGRTIAVLGSAIDCLYPTENAGLAEQIAERGAVISEYPFGRQADRQTFPYRNRIISGLSMGTLVVECGLKSGTLHTADAAAEQGRTVFAVPGRIDSPASQGCNRLIKNGACLVDSVDDILHEFDLFKPATQQEFDLESIAARPEISMSADEKLIIEQLWNEPKGVDQLTRETGLAVSVLSPLLMGLEMKRVVKLLPGRFVTLRNELKQLRTS